MQKSNLRAQSCHLKVKNQRASARMKMHTQRSELVHLVVANIEVDKGLPAEGDVIERFHSAVSIR